MKPWSIEECEAYAKQLRDGTRANTAEHAAQAIEYLLSLVSQEMERKWVGLTPEEVKEISLANRPYVIDMVRALEQRLKEKNT